MLGSIVTGAHAEPALDERVQISIGAAPASSSFYALHAAVADILASQTDGKITARVMETGGAVDNLNLIRQGRAQIGNATSFASAQSYTGTGPWTDAQDDLRLVLILNQTPIILGVRPDSGIDTLQGLDGQPFSAGIAGSATELEVRETMTALGINPEMRSASLEDAIGQYQDGRIMGIAKSAPAPDAPDASFMRLQAAVGLRVLALAGDEAAVVAEKVPALSQFTVPANTYEGQDQPVTTIGHLSGYFSTADVDPAVIYHIAKSILDRKDALDQALPAIRNLDVVETTLASGSAAPLHPGVYQLLRDRGYEVPASLVPPEAK